MQFLLGSRCRPRGAGRRRRSWCCRHEDRSRSRHEDRSRSRHCRSQSRSKSKENQTFPMPNLLPMSLNLMNQQHQQQMFMMKPQLNQMQEKQHYQALGNVPSTGRTNLDSIQGNVTSPCHSSMVPY